MAAAHKLSNEVWKILTFERSYQEEDLGLTERKEKRMNRTAEQSTHMISPEQLTALADRVGAKADVLHHLQEEAGDEDQEVANAG